jgi:hypothetical protein
VAHWEEPVDVVYTWVDDTDPVWIEDFRRHSPETKDETVKATKNFRSHNELYFSTQLVLKHMPWIRDIVIVTCGQKPLLAPHVDERTRIVSHAEIFEDQTHLPTFSSLSIECHLHRIPGLSENFIYFNDDILPCRQIPIDLLRGSHGLGTFSFENKIIGQPPTVIWDNWQFLLWSTDRALAHVYGEAQRRAVCHTPQWYNKTFVEIAFDRWKNLLQSTSSHRFKQKGDVFLRLLYTYTVLYTRFGVKDSDNLCSLFPMDCRRPGGSEYMFIPFGDEKLEYRKLVNAALATPPAFLCVNDHFGAREDAHKELESFLGALLEPEKRIALAS